MARRALEEGCGKASDTSTVEIVKKERVLLGNGQSSKTGGKQGGKGQEKGGKGDIRDCWSCGKTGHIAATCTKESCNKSLNAVEEDRGDITG